MALAIGCEEVASSAAAPANTSHSLPESATTSVTCGLPSVRVPVLSRATVVTLPRVSRTAPTLDEQSAPGACRQAGRDGCRGRDDERAGTTDQEHGKPLVDPRAPGLAHDKGRQHADERRHDQDARRVPAREPVDETLSRC